MEKNLKVYYRSILAVAVVVLGWQVVGPNPHNLLGTVSLATETPFASKIQKDTKNIFSDTENSAKQGVPSDQLCTDSDGGNNPSVRGQTCSAARCAVDVCRDPNTITENFCQAGKPVSVTTTCPNTGSCLNGQCTTPPNILLIMADDHDYELQGFMGHPFNLTPNLDELANKSTIFPNSLTTMSRCRPPLATLLSGQWPHENGIFDNYTVIETPNLDPTNTLPKLLREVGYNTYIGGKFREGDPADYGFTHVDSIGLNFVRPGQTELLNFLEQSSQTKKPFFIWYAPVLPHAPLNAPSEYFVPAPEIVIPETVSTEEQEEFIAETQPFYANIRWFDDRIGEVLNKLTETGLDKNTIVMYMIDNGISYGYVSKGSPFEKGMKASIMIYNPVKPGLGERRQEIVSVADLPTTILDYAGVPVPNSYSGSSLRYLIDENLPLLNRNKFTQGVYSGNFLFDSSTPQTALVDSLYAITSYDNAGHKYIRYLQNINPEHNPGLAYHFADFPVRTVGDEDLFDLRVDPHETENLINDPNYQLIAAELRNSALQFQNQVIPPESVASLSEQLNTGRLTNLSVSKKLTRKPRCEFNKEYSSTNDCFCDGTTPNWTIYRANNGLSCTPSRKTVAICRDVPIDVKAQTALIPGEITVNLNEGADRRAIYDLARRSGAQIRKEPCDWEQKFDGLQTVLLETTPGKEQEVVRIFNDYPLTRAYHTPLHVCTHYW